MADIEREMLMRIIADLTATNAKQSQEVADLTQQVAELNKRIEELTQLLAAKKVKKDSHNSSQPPSSDGYSKPGPKSLRKRSEKK